MQKLLLVTLFSCCFGASLVFGILVFYFSLSFPLWFAGVIAAFSLAGILTVFFWKVPPSPVPAPPSLPFEEITHIKTELQRFQREFKTALRGHLKISILFWIHIYRKDKVKSFEEAKKEIFQDIKREFNSLRWMQTLLEDIRQEISKKLDENV